MMDLGRLLTQCPIDPNVTKEAFLEDIDCMMEVLRECYGGYDYFGHEQFLAARDALLRDLEAEWDFQTAVDRTKAHFYAVVKDGHFSIGAISLKLDQYAYAVRYDNWNDVPVIDCKRFYHKNEAEQKALEEFVEGADAYRNDDPLIIDLRDNEGGSDTYIYAFIHRLFGVEPCYESLFIQRYSPLFREYLNQRGISAQYGGDVQIQEDELLPIESSKPIYVLINEKTFSSGESAVAYLKTISSAVIVGTHTGGAFSFGNCVAVWLPNSHLPVYFGTGMILYEKNRNIDGEGGFRGDISMEAFLGKKNA